MSKLLVVSAVNFSEGGPLTVLLDCLSSAAESLPVDWDIIALVHDKKLINQARIRLIEVPDAKLSWLRRLYHEWFGFRRLSKKLKPDIWLSLHDITPRVTARRQAVYCHNPAPFYCLSWREAWLEPKFWLFNQFYHYLYRAFIKRNHWVVVQQDWLRQAFKQMYGTLPIVVAYPSINLTISNECLSSVSGNVVFLYPAFPRVFKNFEVIGEAAKLLANRGIVGFEIRLTISGKENPYSRWLYAKYKDVPSLQFIRLQNREQMTQQYHAATAVLFPSKLETWGLPISEAKTYNKPIIVADLPYAQETVGTYDQVSFFPPDDAVALANHMQAILEGCWQSIGAKGQEPVAPFARNWDELWHLLTKEL